MDLSIFKASDSNNLSWRGENLFAFEQGDLTTDVTGQTVQQALHKALCIQVKTDQGKCESCQILINHILTNSTMGHQEGPASQKFKAFPGTMQREQTQDFWPSETTNYLKTTPTPKSASYVKFPGFSFF